MKNIYVTGYRYLHIQIYLQTTVVLWVRIQLGFVFSKQLCGSGSTQLKIEKRLDWRTKIYLLNLELLRAMSICIHNSPPDFLGSNTIELFTKLFFSSLITGTVGSYWVYNVSEIRVRRRIVCFREYKTFLSQCIFYQLRLCNSAYD